MELSPSCCPKLISSYHPQHVNLARSSKVPIWAHFQIVSFNSGGGGSRCCSSFYSPTGIGAKAHWHSRRCSAVAVGCSVHVCRSSIWLSPLLCTKTAAWKSTSRPLVLHFLWCVFVWKVPCIQDVAFLKRKAWDILHMGAKKNWADKLIDGMKIKWIMFCGKGAKSDLHSGCNRYNLEGFFFLYISSTMKNGFCTSTTHRTHAHARTHTDSY